MVVVDSLCKRAHFLPVNTTITAEGSARQFHDNVWKLHGLLSYILSDRGPQFTAEFTTELYQLLRIKPAKTTAYHLQADGQTEQVNQELEQYLQLFTSKRQDDSANLLSMAVLSLPSGSPCIFANLTLYSSVSYYKRYNYGRLMRVRHELP